MIKLEKMSVKFPELDLIADWRNESMASLRSGNLTAKGDSQREWVEGFGSNESYYFIYDEKVKCPKFDNDGTLYPNSYFLLGYCGLDKIHQVNRTAEISLLVKPKVQKCGYGSEAVKELLDIGFGLFNLNLIFGECYTTTNNWEFWQKQGFEVEGRLQKRKWWNDKYYDSITFSMNRNQWEKYD